jgi:hypothetical protein
MRKIRIVTMYKYPESGPNNTADNGETCPHCETEMGGGAITPKIISILKLKIWMSMRSFKRTDKSSARSMRTSKVETVESGSLGGTTWVDQRLNYPPSLPVQMWPTIPPLPTCSLIQSVDLKHEYNNTIEKISRIWRTAVFSGMYL